MAVGVPVLLFGLLIAIGPHSIQKVMDKRDFDGKIHTHSTNSTKLPRLSTFVWYLTEANNIIIVQLHHCVISLSVDQKKYSLYV